MNKVKFCEENLSSDKLHYWFLQRGPLRIHLPAFKVCTGNAVQNFLTSDARCVPRFTLIMYRSKLEHILRNIDFNSPALLINRGYRDHESSDFIVGTKFDAIAATTRSRYTKLRSYRYKVDSYFDGLHIDRDIPDLKIIVTHWSDRERPELNADDTEFPIRSVMYLAAPRTRLCEETFDIKNFLGKSKPTFSAARLQTGEFNGGSIIESSVGKIFSIDGKGSEMKSTPRVTITFAGRNVHSAVHYICFEPEFEVKLEEFKRNLNFQVDDGRVVGFLLKSIDHCLDEMYPKFYYSSAILAAISKIFSSVELMKLRVSDFLGFMDESITKPHAILHLIRF